MQRSAGLQPPLPAPGAAAAAGPPDSAPASLPVEEAVPTLGSSGGIGVGVTGIPPGPATDGPRAGSQPEPPALPDLVVARRADDLPAATPTSPAAPTSSLSPTAGPGTAPTLGAAGEPGRSSDVVAARSDRLPPLPPPLPAPSVPGASGPAATRPMSPAAPTQSVTGDRDPSPVAPTIGAAAAALAPKAAAGAAGAPTGSAAAPAPVGSGPPNPVVARSVPDLPLSTPPRADSGPAPGVVQPPSPSGPASGWTSGDASSGSISTPVAPLLGGSGEPVALLDPSAMADARASDAGPAAVPGPPPLGTGPPRPGSTPVTPPRSPTAQRSVVPPALLTAPPSSAAAIPRSGASLSGPSLSGTPLSAPTAGTGPTALVAPPAGTAPAGWIGVSPRATGGVSRAVPIGGQRATQTGPGPAGPLVARSPIRAPDFPGAGAGASGSGPHWAATTSLVPGANAGTAVLAPEARYRSLVGPATLPLPHASPLRLPETGMPSVQTSPDNGSGPVVSRAMPDVLGYLRSLWSGPTAENAPPGSPPAGPPADNPPSSPPPPPPQVAEAIQSAVDTNTKTDLSALSQQQLDELARQLYGRLRSRLATELRLDRERSGHLSDRW